MRGWLTGMAMSVLLFGASAQAMSARCAMLPGTSRALSYDLCRFDKSWAGASYLRGRPPADLTARRALFDRIRDRIRRELPAAEAGRFEAVARRILSSRRYQSGIRGGLGCTTPPWVGRQRAMAAVVSFAKGYFEARARGALEAYLAGVRG